MRSRWMVTAVLAVLAIGCGSSSADRWQLSLATSGGITGTGAGAYVIDSDGRVEVTTSGGRVCRLEASSDDRDRFRRLVTAARPERWRDSYAPDERCCDRIEYRLTITRSGRTRTVEWIDDPLPLPPDLAALAEALNGVRVRYGC